jgi:MFS family permease
MNATADGPAVVLSSAPGRWVLAIIVLGSGIAVLDATVVNIALPAIGSEFHTGVAALQWVMNGYALALAALLLIGGSLGDRFGRRKVYLIGIVWFALASAACGFAAAGLAEGAGVTAVDRTRCGLETHTRAGRPIPGSRVRLMPHA